MKKLFKTFLTIVIIFALVIIFTFAVNSSLRSKGIGGMALNELVSNYVNYMIVVEYETPMKENNYERALTILASEGYTVI